MSLNKPLVLLPARLPSSWNLGNDGHNPLFPHNLAKHVTPNACPQGQGMQLVLLCAQQVLPPKFQIPGTRIRSVQNELPEVWGSPKSIPEVLRDQHFYLCLCFLIVLCCGQELCDVAGFCDWKETLRKK